MPDRFRFLASFVAGRRVDVAEAAPGELAYTDGQAIFLSTGRSVEHQRREVLVQSALMSAGSLEGRFVGCLRGRPSVARRYLLLEGHRALATLGPRVPAAPHLAEAAGPAPGPPSAGPQQSLEIALSRSTLAEPPDFFGVIRPSRLRRSASVTGSAPTDGDVNLALSVTAPLDAEDTGDDEHPAETSKILKLFESPVGAQAAASFLRRLFGTSRSSSEADTAGAELSVGSMRRTTGAGTHARPLPTPIRFDGGDKPGAAVGVGGALYPEWDVHKNRYREDWCRVVDFPMTTRPEISADIAAADAPRDGVLRRRLARVGLGPKALRARADGDDLDTEALIDLFVDLRSGYSPPEHVYRERRKLARNLGVLILVDASGSATDADHEGLAVHEHQRRAAATLAMTLEELGDRVAVYAFRSQGRGAVHLPVIKAFSQRFGVAGRARLRRLQPSGYTRMGAAIRGAGEILKAEAGTPNRLLLVLSDGFPYDHGYEGRYAEADARKALEELRTDGVGCLCLSIGASTDTDSLERVFGSASYAGAATLSELSPRMDELFLAALRELAAPRPPGYMLRRIIASS